jgi:streptomycin 6-kinase
MIFEPYLSLWKLIAEGTPVHTSGSDFLPVRYQGEPAMLKLTTSEEEVRGAGLLVYWGGEGAVRVLARQGTALLLERAEGNTSLVEMVRKGEDGEASRILGRVAGKLHLQTRKGPLPEVVPLETWFNALTARDLLLAPRQIVLLHGDLHHGNVLNGGQRGWLAVDPKGLLGEGGFEYANLFCNPDFEIAAFPGRLSRQVQIVSQATGTDPKRLLEWILA